MDSNFKGKLITDFRCALPREAWSDAESSIHLRRDEPPPSGKWRILDYKSQKFNGSCLQTSHPDAAVLRIPLGCEGWHAVSIGLAHPWLRRTFVEVRLTGETDWHILDGYTGDDDNPFGQNGSTRNEHTLGGSLHEEPWIFADLTGKDLEIRYPIEGGIGPQSGMCSIYSIRAVPVCQEDLTAVTSRQHKYMVQTLASIDKCPDHPRWENDQWDVICSNNNMLNHPFSIEDLRANWPHYPWDEHSAFEEIFNRTARFPIEAKRDIAADAIASAHQRGKRFWYAMRPQSWGTAACHDQFSFVRFFSEHPEFRCVEADGTALSKLSVAYPEVRDWLNNHFREWLRRGADGINIILVRGFPLVRFEEPVARLFAERYGDDIHIVDPCDRRLLQLWSDFVSIWIRELRKLLDEAGPTDLSPRRQLSVFAGPSLEWNMQFGFDVASWAREGLLDVVLPYPSGCHHTYELYGQHYNRPAGWIDVPGYSEALKGTSTELVPSMGCCFDHGRITLATYRQRANRFYKDGATGLCRWDNCADCALARTRFDDPAQQALWCEKYMPPQDNRIVELQGFNVAKYPPGISY